VRRNLASLSRSDLEVAAKELQEGRPVSNKKAWTVINNIEAIGKNVPLSNQQRQMMRRDAFGIIIWNGQPSIWLTINLNDIGKPLCCIVAGVCIPLKISSMMRKKIRRITATNDPVTVARFFKIIVDAFISQIVKMGSREGGIFGPCDAYFGTTEASGRGALHLHCLIWIAGNVGIGNLQERIASGDEFAA